MSDTRISVSGDVTAPVERVFALLADPDRHRDLDTSDMLLRATTHVALTGVGDVFGMEMYNDRMGHYAIENHVVVYETDRALGWAPARAGREPLGHTYVWRLTPTGDDSTHVTLVYDWSAVTDPDLIPAFPVVTAEQLAASVARLPEIME